MLSNKDVKLLLQRPPSEYSVMSVFLDTSVNSENKRTYHVFLNRQRNRLLESAGQKGKREQEAMGRAFERLETWLADEYHEANKGVAFYTQIGGDWSQGIQFPVTGTNLLAVDQRPVVAPLVDVLQRHRHHGVVLVDRENLRLLSLEFGAPLNEHRVRTDPFPAPHDIQSGGWSHADYQQRKAEETRHFFKDFAHEVGEFNRRYGPDDFLILGTDENTKRFIEFFPASLKKKVAHRAHLPESGLDGPTSDVVAGLRPYLDELPKQSEMAMVEELRDKLRQGRLATAGFSATLERLQNGQVEKLLISRGVQREGFRCLSCGFILAQAEQSCPYCSGELRGSVDLAEEAVRMAQEQDVVTGFVNQSALEDMEGVGAVLRY